MRMLKTRAAVLLAWLALAPAFGQAQGPAPSQARAAFERLKELAGEWDQKSTNGWEGVAALQVIGGGSALLATSKVDPHPDSDETMATVFHMDGDRLILTHYCVARNQPRLVAASVSDDGRTITFAFHDATNMRSPDDGHMHGATYVIESRDRFRSRWSFAQKGKERWMEEIVAIRRP